MEKSEGIVLRSIPYQENHRIMTLFSQDSGVISLFVKKSNKKEMLLSLTTPLTLGEYVYTKGNSPLYRFHDGTVLNEHLFLRTRWKDLQTAGEMAQMILLSQMAEKPSPVLYALFLSFIHQIPAFENHCTLLGAFILKLLHHEGVLPETEFGPLLTVRSFQALKNISLSQDQLDKIYLLRSSALGT